MSGVSLDKLEEVFAKPRDNNEMLDNLEIPAGHTGVLRLEFLSVLIPQWRGLLVVAL